MPKYLVEFEATHGQATETFNLPTPEAALSAAQELEEDGDIDFGHHDGYGELQRVTVRDAKGKTLRTWQNSEVTFRGNCVGAVAAAATELG